ncbi:hypothetical protein [Nocardioides sp. SYSU DS0663]|uniref:hypothetical protein n=1 Tax=Nocardioides sp. SYSU DS0663 TaxID=3416445 RepID=UPI003F4C4DB7
MVLDRPVLLGNLVSGAVWLAVPVALGAPVLALVGSAYVVAASVFLAAAYGRETLTRKQEALVWAAPWLAAVAVWTVVLATPVDGTSRADWTVALWAGLVIATGCYLGWQLLALAVRQVMTWRAAAG